MEIKIVDCPLVEGQHERETFMCVANDIKHKRVYFESLEESVSKFKKLTEELEGGVLGLVDYYWDNRKKDETVPEKGYFIFCTYKDKNDEFKYIAFKNRKMYVTNKGTTVDVVE